jgi:PBP1b-binding outer membrane lipoprotein LpoB
MPKKILSLVLAALLINVCGMAGVHAATKDPARDAAAATVEEGADGQQPADAKSVEKIKKQVALIGSTSKEIITVKLRDKKAKTGYVSEITDDHFTLIDKTSPTSIGYDDVAKIRRTHLTTKTMNVLGIVSAAFLAVMVVAVVVYAPRE